MRIGLVQFSPDFGDVRCNVEYLAGIIKKVSADLIVLPELCTTGYFFNSREQVRKLSEKIPDGPACKEFSLLSKRLKNYIVACIAEKSGNKTYNSAVLFGPKGIMDIYRKLHLFNYEKKWFDRGNLPLNTNKIKGARVGMMICFDYFFPETMRTLSLKGAEIICHPSNLVLPYCQDMMITRCLENRVFAVTVNRIGKERQGKETLLFTGRSQVISPKGEILFRASADLEEIKIIEINPESARDKNLNPYNNLFSDRTPRFYAR